MSGSICLCLASKVTRRVKRRAWVVKTFSITLSAAMAKNGRYSRSIFYCPECGQPFDNPLFRISRYLLDQPSPILNITCRTPARLPVHFTSLIHLIAPSLCLAVKELPSFHDHPRTNNA